MTAAVDTKLSTSSETSTANTLNELQGPRLLDMQEVSNRGLVSDLDITPTPVEGTYRIVARSTGCRPGDILVSAYLSLKVDQHGGRDTSVGIVSNLEDPTGNEEPEPGSEGKYRSLRQEVHGAAGDLLEIGRKQLRALGAESLHLTECPTALLGIAATMGFGKK